MLATSLKKNFPKFLISCGLVFLVIWLLVSPAFAADVPGSLEDLARGPKNMDIWFMLLLVAFLMIFIRKFEWTTCLAVILVAIPSILVYFAAYQFIWKTPTEQLWSQVTMVGGVSCAITVVIAVGVFLGTVKPWQYLLAGALFAPAYVLLEYALFTWLPSVAGGAVTDPGGAILVHMFAAYWGLGVALGIRERRAFDEPMFTTKHSLTFAWLAAFLLFMLWPSFVTALLPAADMTLAMINCYMSGFGSIISSFIACTLVSKARKVNPLVFMYALLAGPVASSSSLLLATPWLSFLIGVFSGVVCTFTFTYLQGWLCGKLKVLDVMGAHNLHGVGAWISLLCGAALVGNIINIWGGLITLALGLVAGGITGLILRATRGNMPVLFNDATVFEGYNSDPVAEPAEELV